MADLSTLSSGSSATLTVTSGQFVVLNNGPTDKARLEVATGREAGRVVADRHSGRQVYGPFWAGTLTLSAISGNCGYELSGDATSPLDDDGQPLTRDENRTVRALVSGAGIGPLTISAPAGYVLGATLTATTTPGWVVGGYQWTRNGADISGATSSTYVLTLADVQMPHLPPIVIGCRAASPVYTYLATVPVGTFPDGYLSLNNGLLSIDGDVLSLV